MRHLIIWAVLASFSAPALSADLPVNRSHDRATIDPLTERPYNQTQDRSFGTAPYNTLNRAYQAHERCAQAAKRSPDFERARCKKSAKQLRSMRMDLRMQGRDGHNLYYAYLSHIESRIGLTYTRAHADGSSPAISTLKEGCRHHTQSLALLEKIKAPVTPDIGQVDQALASLRQNVEACDAQNAL